jgi:sugar phosphate isomerase/epimerase
MGVPVVPFTYYLDFDNLTDNQRMTVLNDFAENGGKNLVLTDTLLKLFAGTPNSFRTVQQQMKTAGLTFVDSHAPFSGDVDLMQPDECRSIGLARMMLSLEFIHDCGVNTCCFHLGNAPVFPQYTLDELHTFICKTLEVLLKRAEELKIVICIENIFKPINTVSEILKLIKKFDSPWLGVCYDSGHANIMENGMNFPDSRPWKQWEGRGEVEWEERVLEKLLDHIVICHLHDNDAVNDQHRLPGEGTIDWDYTLSMLAKAPRLTSMQSEVAPQRWNLSLRKVIETWDSRLSQ